MPVKKIYHPMGEVLSAEAAMYQAAQALDAAALFAVDCRDHDALTRISLAWGDLAQGLATGRELKSETDEPNEEKTEEIKPRLVGFTANVKEKDGEPSTSED